MTSEPVVQCAKCLTVLAEPPDTSAEERAACPECGSTVRVFARSGTVMTGTNVVVTVPAATALASAPSPEVVIDNTDKLQDAGFSVQWLRLSEDGAWMVSVFDRQGKWIDCAVQDDPQDAILAVSERLVPPPGPQG